jgi:phytol kinase
MSGLLICIGGVIAIIILSELIWRFKLLKGEFQRKFVHITGGTFSAFWPWLVSWRTIQLLGLSMLIGVLANRYRKFSHFADGVRRETYGDIFSPLAIIICATLTKEPVFFAIAILHLSLADGLAAVIGVRFGKKWKYRLLFRQTKTVIGSMTFWLVSLAILGGGIPYAADLISYETYAMLILILPPTLMVIENLSPFGSDNITVPIAAAVALNMA